MAEQNEELAAIVELSGKDDEFLFEMIGKYDPDSLYALPQDASHLAEAGKKWFNDRSKEFRRYICPKVDEEGLSKTFSEEFVAMVFGYLHQSFGKAMAAYATAVILKKLARGWCRSSEDVT
jgi:hypothetical protein